MVGRQRGAKGDSSFGLSKKKKLSGELGAGLGGTCSGSRGR